MMKISTMKIKKNATYVKKSFVVIKKAYAYNDCHP